MPISDMKDIAPLLTAGIAAGATLLAVVVTSFFNLRVARLNIEAQNRQKEKDLKREKLEELYFLFDKWQVTGYGIIRIYLDVYNKIITIQQARDTVKEAVVLAPGEAQKYKMVLLLHFPSLAASYAPVDAALNKIMPFLEAPDVENKRIEDFLDCKLSLDKACKDFKSEIISVAHKALHSSGS